jgi:cytochrome c551/c552
VRWLAVAGLLLTGVVLVRAAQGQQPRRPPVAAHGGAIFKTSDTCMACHNSLTGSAGQDISIGADWRASMMANSSRDPYWQAAVRRETIDHPEAVEEIEDECAVCHMPMSRALASSNRRKGRVFDHLPAGEADDHEDLLAQDGVSCTLCHQISDRNFGTSESFTGGFVLDTRQADTTPRIFGPFQIDRGRTRVMQSATGFQPAEGLHVRQSEMCATCHTLYTTALGPKGEVVGRLPEQVPYLEWKHSAYAAQQTCQSCHMPVVREPAPIASVLGEPRTGVARHHFRGANFFMLRMLNRFRAELGVVALAQELDSATRWTLEQLHSETATVSIDRASMAAGRLDVVVTVRNLTGHKLPTGYPSRRVWLELTVRDEKEAVVFRSGAIDDSGAIRGNDNDTDPARFEPHYTEIREPDQVQIYESVMSDSAGVVTTGLLRAVRYAKDNRLLPRGFDKATAHPDTAVIGGASDDGDFTGNGDRIRYSIAMPESGGTLTVDATLRFQPIGFRWAENLNGYDARETRRFVGYYRAMSSTSSEVLGRAVTTITRK